AVEFDSNLRMRLWHLREGLHGTAKFPVTQWTAADSLVLDDGSLVERFALREQARRGARLHLGGMSDRGIEKTVDVELLRQYPGFAFLRVSYRNLSAHPVRIHRWTQSRLHLAGPATDEPLFWSFCGSTHADRRDWVQPLRPGFKQDNFMG